MLTTGTILKTELKIKFCFIEKNNHNPSQYRLRQTRKRGWSYTSLSKKLEKKLPRALPSLQCWLFLQGGLQGNKLRNKDLSQQLSRGLQIRKTTYFLPGNREIGKFESVLFLLDYLILKIQFLHLKNCPFKSIQTTYKPKLKPHCLKHNKIHTNNI